MAQKTLAELNTAILETLQDTGGLIFTDTTTQLVASLKEFSSYSPWISTRILTVRDKSRDIDISNLDIINADYAVYPVLLKDSGVWLDDEDLDDNRHNIEFETDYIRMKIDNVPTAGKTDTLTGTVTFTASSTSITGSGTAFSSELRVGWYIRKSGSSTWYRIASISSATALTLAKTVATADDGADTEDYTEFWQSDVYVKCGEVHYITTQTDLAGAIDSGAASGYAAGSWMVHVDALGTGTIYKNSLFTIAGCDGVYRVTADATIGTNEADLYIEPCLREIAPEDAVVTFKPSSLKARDEDLIVKLAASRIAMNWVGDGRTQIMSAVDAAALVNSSTDSMSARLTQAATDIASARTQITALLADADTAITAAGTTLGTALTALGNADTASTITLTTELNAAGTALGVAITDLDLARVQKAALAAAAVTAVNTANTAVDQARTDIASARVLNNTITVSSNAESKLHAAAIAEIDAARAYLAEARGDAYDATGISTVNNLSGGDVNVAMGYLSKARTMISEAANESSLKAGVGAKEISAANGYINQARAVISQTVNAINGYTTATLRELSLANGYLSQAGGYAREVTSRLNLTNIILAYQKWGQNLYASTIRELRTTQKPHVFKTYSGA